MAKRTVLFLAANPCGTDPRALDLEAHSIRAELKRSGYRDRFQLETRWAVQPLDLLRELRELRPAVVHFSNQGGPDGLFFQSVDGRAQIVSHEAIAEAFGAGGTSVQLVVLSACYSATVAEALIAHVDCVVGMSGALHDKAARAFAIGFYGALGDRESVAAAYQHGNAAIRLEGLSEVERPQLKVRCGFDAATLIPAAAPLEVRLALPCPFPGMRPYTANDADHFHGRSAEIDELIGRLRAGEHELCVIGPSGSGKSSLVAAGLLPRLARGVTGLGPFLVRSMRPGERPAERLGELLELSPLALTPVDGVAALLAQRAPGASVLIVIDQLEELFTLADPVERKRFWLAWRALRAEPHCAIIFTLRADFHGAFMESPLWHGRLSYLGIGPLRGEALGQAIVNPARDVGVRLEPELIERLLADAGSEPGVLPLLQETLGQLWDRRQSQTLTLADYQALGEGDRSGLAVALARRADAVLRSLTPTQEAIARRILLRLISFGEGRSDTRRQQPRSKLRADGDDTADVDRVLHQLIAARLLTADDDEHGRQACIDLAHEILIASWPTLASWIQTHREEEQRRRQLEAAAVDWGKHGYGLRGLLDTIELAEAEAWQRTESARELGPSADVAALVAASQAAQDRQRRRRRGLVVGAFAALVVFAVVVAGLAVMARHRASETQRLLAQSYQEAGWQLLVDQRPQEAIAYLAAARQKGAKGEALGMLIGAAIRSLPVIPPLTHRQAVHSATFSPDGTRVVTASSDMTARVWDVATGQALGAPLTHGAVVQSAAFSPDGTRVITASWDKTARVWDAATGKPLTDPLMHEAEVWNAAFSPDGTRVVTASFDGTAQVWDAATGKPLTDPLTHQAEVGSAAFSPDGTHVVTASVDGTSQVWDAATGKPLGAPFTHLGWVKSAAFSPDGTRVVTASDDKTAQVWDAQTGKRLGAPLTHRAAVNSAAFSPDGARVVTASKDKTARVWDAATGKPLGAPLTHEGWVTSAAFSPDGMRVVTASRDGTARVWDAATGKPLGTPPTHQQAVTSATFSFDGTRVVTASQDGTAQVWDAATGKPLGAPLTHREAWKPLGAPLTPVTSAAFSPDGARVVTASQDRTGQVWDLATGHALGAPLKFGRSVTTVAFSLDGTHVVMRVVIRTEESEDEFAKPEGASSEYWKSVTTVAFSPDLTRGVTVSNDETAQVWDAATGQPLGARLIHQNAVKSAAFSPDGTRVVTVSNDKTAQVWDAVTGQPLGAPLTHSAAVNSAAFSYDGTRVVTASDDKTARVWDAATGQPLGAPFTHQNAVKSAAFSPDGTRMVTASDDQTAWVWEIPFDDTPWEALAASCPFVVTDGALEQRIPLAF